MNKFFTSTLALMTFCFFANAQQLNQQNMPGPAAKRATFWDVENAFNEYWKDKDGSETEEENADDGEYEQFKRWEAFAKQRTFPSGEFPSPDALYKEYNKYKQSGNFQKGVNAQSSAWTFVGPHVIPTASGGSGRLNCMAFDPTNQNTIWVGAACGGLWKSTNGGLSWSSNTDLLPALSISEIVFDPSNPQVMYIATGDKYGIYYNYETWGQYSAGILKSTDGGVTWNSTGFPITNKTVIQRLILDSLNTSTLFAATLGGIYKSTDGGTTWTAKKTGKFYDIEFHPTNHSILYAGDSAKVYKTADGGTNWTATSVTSSGRNSIAVTRSFPNAVYVWASNGLYYSRNSGSTFTFRSNPSGNCTPYGYYDMVLEVSPLDTNILIAGGMEIARSTNGGTSWTKVSNWNNYPSPSYVHGDSHAFAFAPGSSTTIFVCNDGGIFKTSNQCTSWSDLSAGIDIKQYYRMSSSFLTPTLIYGGAQDNGTDKIMGLNTATRVYGADGEDCLVDFTDDNIVFVSTQMGHFYRSSDAGVSFTSTGVVGCDWTSPIVMDPNNHNNMYMGGSSIIKSIDNGVTWNYLSGSFDGTCMYSLEVAPSNSNYVYAATFGHIYRTTDAGTTWNNITGTLPVSSAAISGITINSTNPDMVWVTFSGFSAGKKVFYSSNGGAAWTNISGTLPNIPVNCIEYQAGSNDIVYIGTDMGVFGIDASLTDWASYNFGMPNVIIDELEIYPPTNKLRAATFGRGIWEIDLKTDLLSGVADAGPQSRVFVYPNPSNGIFQVQLSGYKIQGVEVYNVLGAKVFSGTGASQSVDISSQPNGIYSIKVRTDRGDAMQKIIIQH